MSFVKKNKEVFIAGGIVVGIGVIYLLIKTLSKDSGVVKKMKDALEKTLGISEIGSDSSFTDANFQKEISSLGWWSGAAWCVFYSKYVWSKMLSGKKWDKAQSLITGNSQTTLANFEKDKSGYFSISKKPKVGSIAIWQYPSNPTAGHAGIVTEVNKDYFMTQEGNYSGKVAKVKRYYNFDSPNSEGLQLKTFINVN